MDEIGRLPLDEIDPPFEEIVRPGAEDRSHAGPARSRRTRASEVTLHRAVYGITSPDSANPLAKMRLSRSNGMYQKTGMELFAVRSRSPPRPATQVSNGGLDGVAVEIRYVSLPIGLRRLTTRISGPRGGSTA